MVRELKALLSQPEEWQIAWPEAALLEELEEAKEVDWRLYVHVAQKGFVWRFSFKKVHFGKGKAPKGAWKTIRCPKPRSFYPLEW